MLRRFNGVLLGFFYLFAIAGSVAADAAECLSVRFPTRVNVGNTNLNLNGLGVRKATFFKVNVYVAGLYLGEKSRDGKEILSRDQPWHLELHFVRNVDASDIRDAFVDGFKNAVGDNFNSLKSRVGMLNSQIKSGFAKADTLAYSYDPGSGTIVSVKGKSGDAIPGSDFANALLQLSIGPRPPNEELKAGLLGGTCE